MSYGSGSLGTASFGAPVAPTPSTGVTINCSIGNAVAVGIPASITSPIVYDYKIAVIGDSNASGRCTNNQPAPVGNTWLYNNSGAVVALADPWDGGPDTYSALEDTSATGSFIPRLAQHFYDAGKTTLWVPANKGGTQTSNWARSLSTTTPYGAMKARIDAAGGVDKILILLGANDAISGVSQSLFVSRMNQLVIDLLSDFPGVEVYLEKVHEFTGYGSQVTVIRAGVTEVWNGTSGVKPGADLDGISPNNVHYTTDADATAVAQRTYPTLIGDIIHGVVGNAVAAGVPATISSIPTHSATGVVTGLTSNVTGTANRYRLHTTTGAATGLTSTVTGSATIQPAPGIHVTSGDVVAGVGIGNGFCAPYWRPSDHGCPCWLQCRGHWCGAAFWCGNRSRHLRCAGRLRLCCHRCCHEPRVDDPDPCRHSGYRRCAEGGDPAGQYRAGEQHRRGWHWC